MQSPFPYKKGRFPFTNAIPTSGIRFAPEKHAVFHPCVRYNMHDDLSYSVALRRCVNNGIAGMHTTRVRSPSSAPRAGCRCDAGHARPRLARVRLLHRFARRAGTSLGSALLLRFAAQSQRIRFGLRTPARKQVLRLLHVAVLRGPEHGPTLVRSGSATGLRLANRGVSSRPARLASAGRHLAPAAELITPRRIP